MDEQERPRYPPGVQPYDGLNAIRIGAITGGILGIVIAFYTGGAFVMLLGGVSVGALAGWGWHRRARQRSSD